MTKVKDNVWKHKGHIITKSSDGWYVSGWNERIRPYMSDTLEGMRMLLDTKTPYYTRYRGYRTY